MESRSGGNPLNLLGAAAMTTSFIMSCFPDLRPLSLSLLGLTLMIAGFSQVHTYQSVAGSCLPTISLALATCVAGYGVHTTNLLARTIVAITALVSVLLQCIVGLKESESPELWDALDAEYVRQK